MIEELEIDMKVLSLAIALSAAFGSAKAQHATPYAGHEGREIKALSSQQVADLRSGRGMGLALPAELNGYPGPMHVLEHAGALGLTPAQRDATTALFAVMRAEAVPLGERLIRDEVELERLFASRTVDGQSIERATAAVGATQGALRAAHLRAHLAQLALLTPEQTRRYSELRGYGASATGDSSARRGHDSHRP